jgi:N-acetylneuraminate lyase
MNSPLRGLIAAPFTPFNAHGELALDVIPRLAALLVNNRVTGAFICGTTGEGYSLTLAERRAVAEAWQAARPATLPLIVHVGHLSLADSQELARHAATLPATAIAAIAPGILRPPGPAELVDWCAEVAAAAPTLPFYYYHMPAITGINIRVIDFLRVAAGRIPNLAGVKFTHEDLMDYAESRAFCAGQWELLFGRDEILLAGLSLGMEGAIGSTYNFAAPLFHRLLAAHAAGDLTSAREIQGRAQQFILAMNRHGGLPAGKAIMQLIGVDCGPVRLPLRSLSAEAVRSLENELRALGFFEYCSQTS